ncbi:MAG: chemotaxis response regulator protein-glutamate methylesterase [Planctomycetota bacterium]|nr:MAG: chemotaxis response regulator protein-glutamate methylesterase [Planctomycetota bacterium]
MPIKNISVLIVDDSRIFRSALEECLSQLDDIHVIGSVFSGEKAIDFLQKQRPDIVTLDMEMPGMNGLETLEKILEFNRKTPEFSPIRVLMLSSFTSKGADITIKALEMGAFDFLAKPVCKSIEEAIESLKNLLILKIRQNVKKILPSSRKIDVDRDKLTQGSHPALNLDKFSFDAVLIGVSTGGPKALMEFIPNLCEIIDVPVFIVQHMPPKFTESLANGLNSKCRYQVIEAANGDIVKDNVVYIAPGGRHLMLRKTKDGIKTIVTDQEPENGCRPSVDVLFRSAPPVYKGNLIVIILTGMGNDGTGGLPVLKRAGAKVIVQDEASCVVWGMPGSAVASGNVDMVLPLNQMTSEIRKLA